MTRSKSENNLVYLHYTTNPFCPVCGKRKDKGHPSEAYSGDRETQEHNCLLSILNEFYILKNRQKK